MPTNRNLRSVAAALLSLLLTVMLLAACPSEVDHSTAAYGDPFDVPPVMAPGPAPMNPHDERALAQRASRSRVEAAEAADRAAAIAALAAAKARAERIAAQSRAVLEAPRPVASASIDEAFWRRLANCECADGVCAGRGNGGGYFQFSPDTALKVGFRPGLSYETQRAMAIDWLGRIKGRGGSTSGWPHCWWVALRG